MKELIGIVENGQIRLPSAIRLPDGARVKITWEEGDEACSAPYEREEWTEADIQAELRWATGKRFSG